MLLIKMPLNIPLAVARALTAIELLAIQASFAVYLVVVFATGGSAGSRKFFHGVDVRVVELIIIHPRHASLHITALNVVVAQSIVRQLEVHRRLLGAYGGHTLIRIIIKYQIAILSQIICREGNAAVARLN